MKRKKPSHNCVLFISVIFLAFRYVYCSQASDKIFFLPAQSTSSFLASIPSTGICYFSTSSSFQSVVVILRRIITPQFSCLSWCYWTHRCDSAIRQCTVYLSGISSRRLRDGHIHTTPLLPASGSSWFTATPSTLSLRLYQLYSVTVARVTRPVRRPT